MRHRTKYYLLQYVFVAMLLFGSISFVEAQRTITGTVTDRTSGDALIGAAIVVKSNTSLGTITDFDGKYSLVVPADAKALIISYTGYDDIETLIEERTVIDFVMDFGKVLDDVVVIGYGTVKREDVTGSIQSVSTEQFNKGSITGAQELLAGKIPGVTITPDPSPGGGAQIRIRGLSSLTASNDPLIVIDGVPIDNGGASGSRNMLNILNPNDIESFSVLKDASATAIYGSRASAGVILITTKKGKLGKKIKISYAGNVSAGVNSNKIDVLTAEEFRTVVNEKYDGNDKVLALLGEADTDWQDEIYRTAIGTDHNLSFSGGYKNIPYRISLGYTNKNGVLKTDNFNRITSSINLTPGFIDNTLQLRVNFKSMVNNNHFADRGAIGNAISYDPTKAVYDDTSSYAGYTTWLAGTQGFPNALAPTNPVALLNLRDDESKVNRYITTINTDYRFPFLKSLRANLNLAYDVSAGKGTSMVPNNAPFNFNALTGGGLNNKYSSKNSNSLLETYLNYKESFGEHNLDVMSGYSWQHFYWSRDFVNSDVAGTPDQTTMDTNEEELYLVSLFGRLQYNYKHKVYVTFSLRSDGSSRFSPKHRWGIFPAASLAMNVIDNDKKVFNNLKVRLGWGVTGQQDIGGGRSLYAYQGIYQYGFENAQYQFGDQFITTLRPNGYAEDIKWEETATYNIAADFSLIKNKLSGSIDLYNRLTTDLLNEVPVPAGSNLINILTINVGDMKSSGVELSLDYTPISTKDMHWTIGTNVAYNKSEITKLTISEDSTYLGILVGGIAGGVGSNIQIHSLGYSPNSFYVYEQLYDESGNILEGEFADRNGDGIVNIDDKYRAFDPAPKYTFGVTNNFRYKNFDIAFAGRASLGNYVYDNIATSQGYLNRLYNVSGALVNIHQSAIDNNIEEQSSITFSDHFVKKASFFRMDHITIGYNFKKVLGDNLRIYATTGNPFVITKYEGLDPEISNGIDNNLYPRARTFLFGVNVDF